MKLSTKEFKKTCAIILPTVSASEALELEAKNKILTLKVSNDSYCLSTKTAIDDDIDFSATINATKFLKLISNISDSVDYIELTTTNNYVSIKANNRYKIPLETLTMNNITIGNPTVTMDIDGDVLNNILAYNTQELNKYSNAASTIQPVQTMYYIDQEGCITFTDGACVNSFSLQQPVQLLLDQNLVKLFKLFKGDIVSFTLGYDALSDTLIQTKVKFNTPNIDLTAIISCNNTLLNQVPVNAIRKLANRVTASNIVIDKNAMLQAFNRLLLFATTKAEADFAVGLFKITADGINIAWNDNEDFVKSEIGSQVNSEYTFSGVIKDFKDVLDTVNEQFITINYGDKRAIIISHNGGLVRNIIPEVESKL